MTANQILDALCYGDKIITKDGKIVSKISISEAGAFRSDERNLRVFVSYANGGTGEILSGDLSVSK